MSKAKFAAAKELIDEKKYDEARAILRSIDHPTAREWEAKIDVISPAVNKARKSGNSYIYNVIRAIAIVFVVVVVVVVLISQIQKMSRDIVPAYQAAENALSTAINPTTPNSGGAVVVIFTSTPLPPLTSTIAPSATPTSTSVPASATPITLTFSDNKSKVIDGITFPAGIYRVTGVGNQNGITVIVTPIKGDCGQGTSFYSKLVFNGESGETTFGSDGCEAIIEVKIYGDGNWKLGFERLGGS